MKIHIRKEHKSITTGFSFEIPSFTVLTGENGSGKTHLFEALSDTKNGQVVVSNKLLNNIKYIPFGGLNPSVDQSCDPNQISQQIKQLWNELNKAQKPYSSQRGQPQIDSSVLGAIRNQEHRKEIVRISAKSSIKPMDLTEDDLAENVNLANLSGSNLFNSQFALIFKTYHVHYIDNKLNKVLAEEEVSVEGLSPYLEVAEFEAKYGQAPWDFVNSILERLKLPYKVNTPLGTKRDTTFIFKLVNVETGIEIATQDLSTGEKTLMSLALAIYNSTESGEQVDMLILDEADAPLHPSMSKLMVEILYEEICNKHGIPVLMSTHSPTTIACVPPESLYKITSKDKSPKQCDLEESIELLSYGIPNLRVSVDNRRQVFVEHSYDVVYLESLYKLISRIHQLPTYLQFLPPHTLNGSNCEAVLNITRTLRDMGNNQVYGLIDWDLHNSPEEQVVVLGMENRYAIENYIFDPHILGIYLVFKNFSTPEELGVQGAESYLDLCLKIRQDATVLQNIAHEVIRKLFPDSPDNLCKVTLISGQELLVHKNNLTLQGHELEEKCKKIWNKLYSVRTNNGGDSELKKDILYTVVKDNPELLSVDLLNTFKEFA